MTISIDIQHAADIPDAPSDEEFRRWLTACLTHNSHKHEHEHEHEVCIRLVDIAEITTLNHQYRQQNKPTNVLSFPAEFPAELQIPLLGDIVICGAVVKDESIQQQKSLLAHWAHITIHGMLHLLGYDHISEDDAIEMETLETHIMHELGYPAPYAEESDLHKQEQEQEQEHKH